MDIHKVAKDPIAIKDFNDRVNKTDGCWNWSGTISKWGYGVFKKYRKHYRAHRLSYCIYNGDIPSGLIVRHTCDNKKCVNPNHLLLGTFQDNSNDMVERGRMLKGEKWHNAHNGTVPYGERHGTAKLRESDVIEILSLLRDGLPQRKIAKQYGVVQGTIANLKKDGWLHLKSYR